MKRVSLVGQRWREGDAMATHRPRAKRSKANPPKKKGEQEQRHRRRTIVLISGAIVVAAIMMVAWFPAKAIVNQRNALNASTSQLNEMKQQDAALLHEQASLSSPGEISRLAREQYQLVEPGQRLIQVLPPSGAPSQSGAGQAPYPGDPGLTKPIAPSAIALLPSVTTTTTQPRATTTTVKNGTAKSAAPVQHSQVRASTSQGLWQRVVGTLSFWKQ